MRINAKDAGIATNVHVAGEGDLLRKRENEFDGAAGFQICFDQEVKAAKTDVAGLTRFLRDSIACRESDSQGKHHRKAPGGATLHTVLHEPSVPRDSANLPSLPAARNGFSGTARRAKRRICRAGRRVVVTCIENNPRDSLAASDEDV